MTSGNKQKAQILRFFFLKKNISFVVALVRNFIPLKQNISGTTKEDVEGTSGEGEQECWFGEGGCHELSEMKSGS